MRQHLTAAIALTLASCAHHHAVQVNCDGRLRPINIPAPVAPEEKAPSGANEPNTVSGPNASEPIHHD